VVEKLVAGAYRCRHHASPPLRVVRTLVCLLALLWLPTSVAGQQSGELPQLLEVQRPALDSMEPAVREQLETARSYLDTLTASSSPTPAGQLAAAWGDLGELYLVYDLGAAAVASLENAARLQPRELRWPHLIGTYWEHERELAKAAEWYERARAANPGYEPTLLRLGKVRVLLGDLAGGRELLTEVLELTPGNAAAHAWLGRAALGDGDIEAAIRHFETALALQPQASAVHYQLAQAYRRAGDVETARRHIEQSGELEASFADPIAIAVRGRASGVGAYNVLIRAAMREGDVAGAEAQARKAVAAAPDSPVAHRLLAAVLQAQNRLEEAADSFRRAVELDPEDVSLRMSLARTLAALGRDEELVEQLEEARRRAPEHAPIHGALGSARVRAGDLAGAVEHLEEAARLDPDGAGVSWMLAETLEHLGRDDEARAEAERLLALRPDLIDPLRLLVRLDLAAGRDAEAIENLRRLVELAPDDLAAHESLAVLLGRQGRYLQSASHQARVVAARPEDADGWVLLATARILGGDLRAAAGGLVEAMRLHPNDPRLADALGRLLSAAPDDSLRDGARALQLALAVYEDNRESQYAETLAMALAEVGRFDEAVTVQQGVVTRLRADPALAPEAERAEAWLESYRRGEALRAPWSRRVG
jgi:tetratricopeptide (TPR) repeat protein